MTTLTNLNPAIEQINSFSQKFGRAHLQFAYHAAFPLALTPTLAYRLWNHFQQDIHGNPLNIPWVAVSDLLLSPLCELVEPELYEISLPVRQVLLNELKLDANFGEQRLRQLSDFVWLEAQRQLQQPKYPFSDVAELHQWIALSYTDNREAARQLAQTLQAQDWGNQLELIRLATVMETFTDTLAEFQPLLLFSQAMGKYGRGDLRGATEIWSQLGDTLDVSGVRLQIPQFFEFETVTVNRKGEIIKREQKQARYFTEDLGKGVTLEMVYIPGGEFLMGSPDGEKGEYDDEKPQHRVKVQPFFMSKYPITQEQWEIIAQEPEKQRKLDPNPSRFKGKKRPVEKVNWYDTIEWCARLSGKTGKQYSLPSEAQWEYGCRGGTETPFHYGETLTSELANYNGTSTYAEEAKSQYREETTEVGKFPPNAFGLYDCHGNVWEWCLDPWHNNYEGSPTDGSVWDESNNENHYQNLASDDFLVNILNDKRRRLLRGGSWFLIPDYCRAACRSHYSPDGRDDIRGLNGFRVVCAVAVAWT